jgi:hypothetical protein
MQINDSEMTIMVSGGFLWTLDSSSKSDYTEGKSSLSEQYYGLKAVL